MKIYYCIDKDKKEVLSCGELPNVWGTITGMGGLNDESVSDLTWAGYPSHSFVDRGTALSFGILESDLVKVEEIHKSQQGEINAQKAKILLQETDWCEIPSVRNINNTPHLINATEFDSYRLWLRNIVVNKISDVENWLDKPKESWQ